MKDLRDIKISIDYDVAKKILGNKENAINYLSLMGIEVNRKQSYQAKEIYNLVVENWDYETSLKAIREIFRKTKKYCNGKSGEMSINILIEEWKKFNFGEIKWPFSQGQFDNFVQRINSSEKIGRIEKDDEVKIAAVKYRRIKELNTARNDFLETLIFDKSSNILPTLLHNKGIDFFINGISYDQKVAKSPTNEFKKDFGQNWKSVAIENPKKVIEYLYKYQDEGRFGASPRLYVVYLDEDITPCEIKNNIQTLDLQNPYDITFKYNHKDFGSKSYKTQAYIVLLYNSKK